MKHITKHDNDPAPTGARGWVWLALASAAVFGVVLVFSPRNQPDIPSSADVTITEGPKKTKNAVSTLSSPHRASGPEVVRPVPYHQGKSIHAWLDDLTAPGLSARQEALEALKQMGPEAAPYLPELKALLASPNAGPAAADVMTYLGPQAFPYFLEALRDGNEFAKSAAASALGWFQKEAEEAVPSLATLATEGDSSVKLGAIGALERIAQNPHVAVPALSEALRDDDPEVRAAAASALAKFGDGARSAVPLLTQMAAEDFDVLAQERAAEALKALNATSK